MHSTRQEAPWSRQERSWSQRGLSLRLRWASGTPHLHFTAYTADGPWGHGTRQSLPLRFVEGYNLPDVGGCNQHVGKQLVSGNRIAGAPYHSYVPMIETGTVSSAATQQRLLRERMLERWWYHKFLE